MNYHIQVFAGLAELMGRPMITVPADQETMTVNALKDLLSQYFPEAAAQLQGAFVARNQAYAAPEDLVSIHDEIAIIPPVSGG
ncbi:molybdopterin synthase sulfur carrier subunit [Paenibacillus jamilae]|jgi:molybdopterin synthase sulfur carrier subunit|uniref:MoaD/ThiS family protein n=1 Tax=Paenibacillus TaxID=44249 RepID=UPI0005CF594F|nr:MULTISPECIES: MoaD/ThiS family protein [Paenibacillus]MDP9674383.1 molybdopterin synthase sulfur carrier subunit [Paenibacillus jamilae]KAF6617335.1 MoaD/ThiS family protein [Paenibacillus sp. EKM101P]KAF6622137.1 MoaD/ThiS family protein [Paenibacillus sp. EKM102P]KAF6631311.1 MoaD/ThiS family protein [Paenibacillus sp. EKM10P]KAF6650161.1 MoaD/ThiS family protein [Paenibacillus sp. EKM11P]